MASKYLRSAIYDQLKYVGWARTKDLEKIKAEFCKDIETVPENLRKSGSHRTTSITHAPYR